jgi:anti-sigma factor RsiW
MEHIKMTNQTMLNAKTETAQEDPQAMNLSALIDGELTDYQANLTLKQIGKNVRAQAQLADYLTIGDAMRGLSTRPNHFTDRVMAALENEPVILAPMPKSTHRRPALWLAAAAMTAITWGLWQSAPNTDITPPLAALQPADARSTQQNTDSLPYLVAHQDFTQAVISAPEMHFSNASLETRQ